MANWEFEGGEAKSGLMGLLAMTQNQLGLEAGADNQYVIISPDDGVLTWFGDRGDGVVEQLASISSDTQAIGYFGSLNSTKSALYGISKSSYGVYGYSVSGSGVRGISIGGSGYGGYFQNSGGIGIYVAGNGTQYSIYADTSYGVYATGNISAASYTDRAYSYNLGYEIYLLKSKVTVLEGKVNTLQSNVSSLDSRVTALEAA
jgi:hypothetical protein